MLLGASLSLLGLVARGELELSSCLSCWAISGASYERLSEQLLWIVLRSCMISKVCCVLLLYLGVEISEDREGALSQQLEFLRPDDGNTHELPSVCHDRTREQVWVLSDEAFLIHAEISEEFGIFPEMLCQLDGWLHPLPLFAIIRILLAGALLECFFVLK